MNQKQFILKQDWAYVLGSKKLAEWMNQCAKIINGIHVIQGGDTFMNEDGIQFRIRAGGGSAAKPPWWPTVKNVEGALQVHFETAMISNITPRVTWSDSGTRIGQDNGYLELTNGTSGLIVVKNSFDTSMGQETTKAEISVTTTGVPASSIPSEEGEGFFYVATHSFFTYEPEGSPGTWKASVRPLYFHSLNANFSGWHWYW